MCAACVAVRHWSPEPVHKDMRATTSVQWVAGTRESDMLLEVDRDGQTAHQTGQYNAMHH